MFLECYSCSYISSPSHQRPINHNLLLDQMVLQPQGSHQGLLLHLLMRLRPLLHRHKDLHLVLQLEILQECRHHHHHQWLMGRGHCLLVGLLQHHHLPQQGILEWETSQWETNCLHRPKAFLVNRCKHHHLLLPTLASNSGSTKLLVLIHEICTRLDDFSFLYSKNVLLYHKFCFSLENMCIHSLSTTFLSW